jgi:NAD(P)-dependent dehydrogenase (short-subunit alcohol dehydrogenase family)
MNASFDGKVVVVTGGAQGIGLATATAFRDVGARVQAWDVDEEALSELEGIEGVLCDVGVPEEIERAAAGLERVDLLVNNSGIGAAQGLLELTVEDWDRVLAVNLRSHWLCTKLLAPKMPEGSAIVNIASTRAFMSEPNTETYSASKGGVVALTHAMAITLSERRIRVNSIRPGWIETSLHQKSSKRHEPELRALDHAQHPAGRVGVPEDIARAVLFLCSPDNGFVTGANLVIDGGMTVKMIYQE